MSEKQKFDDLSDDYDRHRPRYPEELFSTIASEMSEFAQLTVVDTGAGTGIALEGLSPALEKPTRYIAVDVSQGMVDKGKRKFPGVEWIVGPAEQFLEQFSGQVQLIIAAQAYQWMDRERYLSAASAALVQGGALAVIQNNRNHRESDFLAAYESLLEDRSPGYSRKYRDFDIEAEIAGIFEPGKGKVKTWAVNWIRSVSVEDFTRMASSSTQVQRAIAQEGQGFLGLVRELCELHAKDGHVDVPYRSELFLGIRG